MSEYFHVTRRYSYFYSSSLARQSHYSSRIGPMPLQVFHSEEPLIFACLGIPSLGIDVCSTPGRYAHAVKSLDSSLYSLSVLPSPPQSLRDITAWTPAPLDPTRIPEGHSSDLPLCSVVLGVPGFSRTQTPHLDPSRPFSYTSWPGIAMLPS